MKRRVDIFRHLILGWLKHPRIRLLRDALAAKLQQVVAALDQDTQNFPAACGVSTGLLRELHALISTGMLAELTFPPPVPGAPTTVLGLAELTNDHFCEAAHE